MQIKYLFADIDGTLLNEHHEVTPRTRAAVEGLKNKGVEVVLCSARPPAAMVDIVREAGASPVMICCAGAVVCNGEDILESVHLPTTVLKRVRKALRDSEVSLNLYLDFDWYVEEPDEWSLQEAAIVGFLPERANLDELQEEWTQQGVCANKLLLISTAENIQAILPAVEKAVDGEAQVTLSKDNYLEILPNGVDKGSAARDFRILRGIRREETAAAGDQDVDVSLLQGAGIAIAMENGSEKAKAAAHHIAPPNTEDGLAQMLEKLFLTKT